MHTLDARRIILFDGVCNLCGGIVQFVLKHDKRDTFHFAALQSEAGQTLLRQHGLPTDAFDSFVLVQGDQTWERSDAALQVVRHLDPPWRWLFVVVILPKRLRDALYNVVARHRYRWFGKKKECLRPGPDVAHRFLP